MRDTDRVGTEGSVTQLPVPTQSQSSSHCHPLVFVCICMIEAVPSECVCVHMFSHMCGLVQVYICTRLLTVCACRWPALCECSYPPPTNQQTTPGLKMDLLELSALLVLARWLCFRWFLFFFFFSNSQNWFGLIFSGSAWLFSQKRPAHVLQSWIRC